MTSVNHLNYSDNYNQVYCRKLHKILDVTQLQCKQCTYFTGFLQGYGVECTWNDVVTQPIKTVKDPKQELLRVSALLDKQML